MYMDGDGLVYHGLSVDDLVGFLEPMEILRVIDVAVLTLLVLEYLETLPMDVKFVWPTRFSFIKVLYFVNRHVIFIAVVAPHVVRSNRCQMIYIFSNISRVVALLASEGLLFLRVWALSGNSPRFGVCLLLFVLATGTVAMTLMIMFTLSAQFIHSPWPSTIICINTFSNGALSAMGISLLLLEQFTVAGISLFLGVRKHGRGGGHLGKVLYRDGALYIFTLTFLAITNVVYQQLVTNFLRYGLNSFHFAMHSILCTRMVLHLRKEARAQMGFTTAAAEIELDLRTDAADDVFVVTEGGAVDVVALHRLRARESFGTYRLAN